MAGSGESRANANRRIRQDALREQLAEQCRLQHIIDNIEKMENLAGVQIDSGDMLRIKTANEQRLKLLDKYLPSLKSVEMSGPMDDNGLPTSIEIKVKRD